MKVSIYISKTSSPISKKNPVPSIIAYAKFRDDSWKLLKLEIEIVVTDGRTLAQYNIISRQNTVITITMMKEHMRV